MQTSLAILMVQSADCAESGAGAVDGEMSPCYQVAVGGSGGSTAIGIVCVRRQGLVLMVIVVMVGVAGLGGTGLRGL
jgi:hypothetical protein